MDSVASAIATAAPGAGFQVAGPGAGLRPRRLRLQGRGRGPLLARARPAGGGRQPAHRPVRRRGPGQRVRGREGRPRLGPEPAVGPPHRADGRPEARRAHRGAPHRPARARVGRGPGHRPARTTERPREGVTSARRWASWPAGPFGEKVPGRVGGGRRGLEGPAERVRAALEKKGPKWGLHLAYALEIPEAETVVFGTTGTPDGQPVVLDRRRRRRLLARRRASAPASPTPAPTRSRWWWPSTAAPSTSASWTACTA